MAAAEVSASIDEEKRELRMTQMRVDIGLEREQLRWEPWKVIIASAGAGAAFMGATIGLLALIFRAWA